MKREELLLKECLSSGDPERWLREHEGSRRELEPYLKVERALLSASPEEGSEAARQRALSRVLLALDEPQRAPPRVRVPVLPLAAAAAGLALFLSAGAGAFFSGANPVEEALTAIHVLDGDDEEANENASQGADNADDGINNASENATNGRDHANENASEGSGNADDRGANGDGGANADENAQGGNENASEGADNAGQGADNANPTANRGNSSP